jgi:hypothetical protein
MQDQSLANIQNYFGIKLPPPTTSKGKTTSYSFKFKRSLTGVDPWQEGVGGHTPWFDKKDWGDVDIFQITFEYYKYNAYDIAAYMVHEATHAWQQYSIAEMARTPGAFLSYNFDYYTSAWRDKYDAAMEVEAYQQALNADPNPLCLRQNAKNKLNDWKGRYAKLSQPTIRGINSITVPLLGYPLP